MPPDRDGTLACDVCGNWLVVTRLKTGVSIKRAKLTAADIAYLNVRKGAAAGAA